MKFRFIPFIYFFVFPTVYNKESGIILDWRTGKRYQEATKERESKNTWSWSPVATRSQDIITPTTTTTISKFLRVLVTSAKWSKNGLSIPTRCNAIFIQTHYTLLGASYRFLKFFYFSVVQFGYWKPCDMVLFSIRKK